MILRMAVAVLQIASLVLSAATTSVVLKARKLATTTSRVSKNGWSAMNNSGFVAHRVAPMAVIAPKACAARMSNGAFLVVVVPESAAVVPTTVTMVSSVNAVAASMVAAAATAAVVPTTATMVSSVNAVAVSMVVAVGIAAATTTIANAARSANVTNVWKTMVAEEIAAATTTIAIAVRLASATNASKTMVAVSKAVGRVMIAEPAKSAKTVNAKMVVAKVSGVATTTSAVPGWPAKMVAVRRSRAMSAATTTSVTKANVVTMVVAFETEVVATQAHAMGTTTVQTVNSAWMSNADNDAATISHVPKARNVVALALGAQSVWILSERLLVRCT